MIKIVSIESKDKGITNIYNLQFTIYYLLLAGEPRRGEGNYGTSVRFGQIMGRISPHDAHDLSPDGAITSQAGVSTPVQERGAAAEPRRGGTGIGHLMKRHAPHPRCARVRAQKKGSTRKD